MQTIAFDQGVRIGVTSDTHYNHSNIIKFCCRPFLDPDEQAMAREGRLGQLSPETVRRHDDAVVERINARLGPDDVLIHGGDVAWNGVAKLAEFYDRLRVRRVYVAVGNHDDEDDLVRVFGRASVFERFAVAVGTATAVIDHYPGDRWDRSHHGAWLLFAHAHGALNTERRANPAWDLSLDVGGDSHSFYPWLWREELVPLFAARKPAWDQWRARAYPGKEAGGMAPVGPADWVVR